MRFLTLLAIFVALAVSVSADGTNECNEGFDECGPDSICQVNTVSFAMANTVDAADLPVAGWEMQET